MPVEYLILKKITWVEKTSNKNQKKDRRIKKRKINIHTESKEW